MWNNQTREQNTNQKGNGGRNLYSNSWPYSIRLEVLRRTWYLWILSQRTHSPLETSLWNRSQKRVR
jgi:hypothetical protein